MNLNLNQFLLCFSVLEITLAYKCYRCSYAEMTEGDRRECILTPDSLGYGARLECNATSFCVLSEQYDLGSKKVTSYFRTCSGTTWGNECAKDWSHVTCYATCQGDYCNRRYRGKLYREYMAKHDNDGRYRNGQTTLHGMHVLTAAFTVTFVAFVNKLLGAEWLNRM